MPLNLCAANKLKGASITFVSPPNSDNKDKDTKVSVEISAVKDASPTVIAGKDGFAGDQEFKDEGSVHSFDLDVRNACNKEDVYRLVTKISESPNGNDRWIFNYTLVLTFDDDSRIVQSSDGIILDQDVKTRITSNWVQVDPINLNHELKSAQIIFTTPANRDNKNDDTKISVDVTTQLNARLKVNAVRKLGFAGDQEFKDDGSSHTFDLDVVTPITLKDYNKSVTEITISPSGNDRWIFDFRMLLTFVKDNNQIVIEESGTGIILDQDFRTLRIQ
jgi:hypothetical protein